jgi:hypothetical protein
LLCRQVLTGYPRTRGGMAPVRGGLPKLAGGVAEGLERRDEISQCHHQSLVVERRCLETEAFGRFGGLVQSGGAFLPDTLGLYRSPSIHRRPRPTKTKLEGVQRLCERRPLGSPGGNGRDQRRLPSLDVLHDFQEGCPSIHSDSLYLERRWRSRVAPLQ